MGYPNTADQKHELDLDTLRILKEAPVDPNTGEHAFQSAYQIVNRYREPFYSAVTARGLGGRGRGNPTELVASQIAQRSAQRLMKAHIEVEIIKFDTRDIIISTRVSKGPVLPGYAIMTGYRLKKRP